MKCNTIYRNINSGEAGLSVCCIVSSYYVFAYVEIKNLSAWLRYIDLAEATRFSLAIFSKWSTCKYLLGPRVAGMSKLVYAI